MPYESLRDFIQHLENSGDLVRVREPVSPVLEMTEIQTRLLAAKGPAILLENVVDKDHQFDTPVLINLFGTTKRVAGAIEKEPNQLQELGRTLAALRQPEPPGGWREDLYASCMIR